MGRANRQRIDTLVMDLARKRSIAELLETVKETLKPFKDQVKSVRDFEIWFYQFLRRSHHYNTAEENSFLKATDELRRYLMEKEGCVARSIDIRLLEFSLFGKLPKKHKAFGISHFIDTDVDDSDYYASLGFKIDPGTNKKEFLDYVDLVWPKWEKVWRQSTWPDDKLLHRIRPKNKAGRDQEILKLYSEGKSDREISSALNMGGKLSLVRQVVSRAKKRGLL